MVPTGKHVQDVYVGEGKSVLNALKSMREEQRAATLCMDQSTIEQSVSKAVALKLREAGADLVDAPVSGGRLDNFSTLYDVIVNLPVHRCRWRREGHPSNHGRRIQGLLRSSSHGIAIHGSQSHILWGSRRWACRENL